MLYRYSQADVRCLCLILLAASTSLDFELPMGRILLLQSDGASEQVVSGSPAAAVNQEWTIDFKDHACLASAPYPRDRVDFKRSFENQLNGFFSGWLISVAWVVQVGARAKQLGLRIIGTRQPTIAVAAEAGFVRHM